MMKLACPPKCRHREPHVLKLMTPKTKSPSNADLAPLPERRRSTFREPATEVDLGLFGLAKGGDPEAADVTDVEAEADVVVTPDVASTTHVADAAVTTDTLELPVVADAPDAPVVEPSQHRARHRADRSGNRRASGGSSLRIALPAY